MLTASGTKPLVAHRWAAGRGRSELTLPALAQPVAAGVEDFAAVWRGDAPAPTACVGTIALGLLAVDPALSPEEADRRAAAIWVARR